MVNCQNCTMFYEKEGTDFGFCTMHCIYVDKEDYNDECHEYESDGE